MRKILLLFFASAVMMAQEQTVNLSMGASYANEVFFKFSDLTSQSFDKNAYDLAFYRVSNFDQGIRINDGKGLNVYEMSTNPDDWATISADPATGTALYNSAESWNVGAFNAGSASYGWGEYNPANHHVSGAVIFLIENSITSDIYKFFIEDYFGAYTFKYAKWNGTAWGEDQNVTIPNTIGDGHFFNFFNLESGETVTASPSTSGWDMVFKKYTEMVPTNAGEFSPYTVTGVLMHPNVTVAKVEEETGATGTDTNTLTFSDKINVIGYEWKQLNSSWAYEIVPNQVFYVKSNDIVYRMYFTSFAGSSTGDLEFVINTEDLSTVDLQGEVKFAVYPNPVKNNQITLVYDNTQAQGSKAIVEIYNMTGQRVFNTSLNNAAGLFQRNIQLNHLSKGVYILKFVQGNVVKTEKLIIQ